MRESAAAYNEVYVAALGRTLDAYDAGDVLFTTEHDVQAELMAHCRAIMVEREFERPFRMSSDLAVGIGKKRAEHDLVLGLGDEDHATVTAHLRGRPLRSLTTGAAVGIQVKFERAVKMGNQRKRSDLRGQHYDNSELPGDLVKLAGCPADVVHRHFLAIDEKAFWPSRVTAADVHRLAGVDSDWVRRRTVPATTTGCSPSSSR